jgi:hypothetical protein
MLVRWYLLLLPQLIVRDDYELADSHQPQWKSLRTSENQHMSAIMTGFQGLEPISLGSKWSATGSFTMAMFTWKCWMTSGHHPDWHGCRASAFAAGRGEAAQAWRLVMSSLRSTKTRVFSCGDVTPTWDSTSDEIPPLQAALEQVKESERQGVSQLEAKVWKWQSGPPPRGAWFWLKLYRFLCKTIYESSTKLYVAFFCLELSICPDWNHT